MGKIVCKSCGKELNIESFTTYIFCSACGTKNEIKADIEESESKSNKDKYIKYKANLHNAYIGRNITEIMECCYKVLDICPDDFFAEFLLSYCHYRRGNSLRIQNFLVNFHYNDVSSKEIEIVMTELTKDNSLYNEKCAFILKLHDSGVDVSKYLGYCKIAEKKAQEEKKSNLLGVFKLLNNLSFIISLIILIIIIGVLGSESVPPVLGIYLIISLIVLIVNHIITMKKGYSLIRLIITLVFPLGIYVVLRFFFAVLLSLTYKGEEGASFMKIFLCEGER